MSLPAEIATEWGSVTAVELLCRVAVIPPFGAGPLRIKVPVEEVPPFTEAGLRLTDTKAAAVIVSVAFSATAPFVAVMVTDFWAVTAVVLTRNVAVFWPAATVTVLGTVTEVSLQERETMRPPVGAGPENVTVPVELSPPGKVVGFSVSEASANGVISNVTIADVPLSVAVIVAAVVVLTLIVPAVNVAVVCPAGTVTVAGTDTRLLHVRETAIPPAGAGPPRVTVPTVVLPPTT